jgi:hypothetical protein
LAVVSADLKVDLARWRGRHLADQIDNMVGWEDCHLADQMADFRKWQVQIFRDLMQDRIGWEGRHLMGRKGDPGQNRDMDLRIIGRRSDQGKSVLGNNTGIGDSRIDSGRPILKDQIDHGWHTG